MANFSTELQSFETDITHNREDFFAFCFSVRGARGHRRLTVQKARAYDVRKAPFRDLLISIHKTRGFEWQTAHTNGCLENRCASRWPKTFIYYVYLLRPTSISLLRICQSPTTKVVIVACLRCVFFVSLLIATCSLGSCSWRKQFIYASCGFCPNGGEQHCRCFQIRHKLVRAVRLIVFVTTVIDREEKVVSSG